MSYKRFFFTLFSSFIIMYTVMFLNVDELSHVFLSLNRLYMSVLMVSPMAVLMMLMMGKMYPKRTANRVIVVGGVVVFMVAFVMLRKQSFIGDRNYMKAMIPHHSSAILTSANASLKDPEVQELARQIIKTQEEEIAQMKRILDRME